MCCKSINTSSGQRALYIDQIQYKVEDRMYIENAG
jgi:hypothetical protein